MRMFNNKEWALAKETAAALRKRYRSAFPRDVVPLKVGIDADIIADGHYDPRHVKLALAFYVATPRYLKACIQPGAMRHDLNGVPVEPVTPTEAAYAADPYGHKSNASARTRPLPAQGHT